MTKKLLNVVVGEPYVAKLAAFPNSKLSVVKEDTSPLRVTRDIFLAKDLHHAVGECYEALMHVLAPGPQRVNGKPGGALKEEWAHFTQKMNEFNDERWSTWRGHVQVLRDQGNIVGAEALVNQMISSLLDIAGEVHYKVKSAFEASLTPNFTTLRHFFWTR
jgi:hypothetical protein